MMKTNVKDIAAILATAIYADGVFDEAEEIALGEIQEALELNKDEFEAAMNEAIENVDKLDEEAATEFLQNAAAAVADDEIGPMFEAALQLVLADGIIKRDEVATLLVISDALGIEDADAVLLIADFVKEEADVTVEI
ncbi:MAG: TerB family tellurite resistance protein [Bacteroidales bacterium]|nr:TerB family tellurite resistance protein [Bacteroidales bacterium]